MSLSMGILAVALLAGIGLLALGLKAYRQNIALLRSLRTGTRDLKSMLRQALLVWSPMLLVIIFLLGIASAISWGITELAYRYSTIDEFCEIEGLESAPYIACTGMGHELAASKIRGLDPRLDIERQLFGRYSAARKQVLATTVAQLHEQAKNPVAFLAVLSPSSVLGLPSSPEDDLLLASLVTQHRRLLQTPVPLPSDIVGMMSYPQSVESRNRTLIDLQTRIQARRKAVYVADYRRLPLNQRPHYVKTNRLLFQLRQLDVKIDPAVLIMLSGPAEAANRVQPDFIHKALVRSLANDEQRVSDIILREVESTEKTEMVYQALGMVPECTVAQEDSTLRIASGDFVNGYVDPETMPTSNAGSFPCLAKANEDKNFKLVSVGFRKSVLLSIDRMRDETAFHAFRKLATLEQETARGTVDTKSAAQALGSIVPSVIPLGRQECSLFHPINCVMNAFASSAEAAYTRSRNQLIDQYNQQTSTKVDMASMTIQQKINHARISTDGEVARLHEAGYKTAESLFGLNDLFRLFAWLALILIAARSFLYVFALEVFDREGEYRISFDVGDSVVGNVVSGSEITIDRNYPLPIINRGSLTNTLADIEIAPWRWSAPLTRMLHGRYFLFNRSVFSPPGQASASEEVKGMEASAKSGFSIVEWKLQPGEEVMFHYRDFYGASVNVELKTDFSLRLSTLLLGKVFFHYARCTEGEGRLLLEARVHNTTQGGMSSIKPSRLLAWNRHAQFTAGSHRHPWKTFINPFTIVRESTPGLAKALVIIAPENESSGFFGTGIRSVKRVFSRIF